MADEKITQLNELNYALVSIDDVIAIVDISSGETKKLKIKQLIDDAVGFEEAPADGKQYARQDVAWEVVLNDKVKATSQGTPGFLNAVLALSDFLENAGDSEQIIIKGRQASSTEVINRSVNKVLMNPSQLPKFTALGRPFPSLGNEEKGGGVVVKRIQVSTIEYFQFGLAIESLSALNTEDLSLMRFPVYDVDDQLNGYINGLFLQQIIGGLSGWSMAASPNTFYSNVPPYTSFISVHDSNGTQYDLATTQFSVLATDGHVNNVTFTDIGNVVTAELNTDGTAFDSSGSVYGYAIIKWTHPTLGGSITRTIELINNEPAGGGGAGGVDIAIQEVSTWPATSDDIDSNCILINTSTGEMRHYQYDSVNDQYCYIPYTTGSGSCLAAKSKA